MVTDDLFLAVLERSKETGGLVMVHAENGFAIEHLVKKALAAGDTDPIYHALTRPEEFEAEATGRAIRLAEYAGAPIFVVHVSCKRAADEIIAARARGVPAYGETCIQYLFTSIDDLRRPDFEGARYVCSPPLRDARNQDAPLGRAALRPPAVDLDRPLPVQRRAEAARLRRLLEDPERPRGDPAPAAAALGARRARAAGMSPNRFVEMTSTAIAKIFGLHPRKGTIAPGADADIVIFDPNRRARFSTRRRRS